MKNFQKFTLNSSELIFGGELHPCYNDETGQRDVYSDVTNQVYILED